ncbi:MAG: amidohydrolase family protein [Clostridia bacterium]|nr:amidohydrolase family protein [Clostridia bacterium]
MKLIDANCMIGRRNSCREGSPVTMEDYIEIMDRCGIEKAVAFHSAALEYDPKTGNEKMKSEPFPERFMPQWVVIPNVFDRFYPANEMISEMKENGVTSVRLMPGVYRHSLRRYAIGDMMDAFAECKVPVFIDKPQLEWAQVYDFCKEYPNVNLVLCSCHYALTTMELWPIMKECPNLYVETSTFVMHNGIAKFSREFGAERFLFGSGMPTVSATASASMIFYASVSQEEKELIGHGNITRLLGEVSL